MTEIKKTDNACFEYRNSRIYKEREKGCEEKAKRIFQLAVDHQYEKAALPLQNKTVTLHCEQAAGFGDVSQTFLCAEVLKKQRPDCKINIAILCQDSDGIEKIKSMFPVDRFETQFFTKWDDYAPREKKLQEISEAGCAVGIAAPIRTPNFNGRRFRNVFEYGFSNQSKNGEAVSMGFSPEEEGLNIPSVIPRNLHALKTPWLREAFHIQAAEDAERYSHERKLYHMYTASVWTFQVLGLYSVGEIEKANNTPIDVFMPMKYTPAELIRWGYLDIEALKAQGIGKLVYQTSERAECIEIGEGKEMRILSGSIPKSDMEIIQQHSQPFFGCTGDLSLSEGFALENKVLFYVPLDHKLRLVKSWKEEVSKRNLHDAEALLALILDLDKAIEKEYIANKPKINSWFAIDSTDLSDPHSYYRRSVPKISPMLKQGAVTIASLYHNSNLKKESIAFNHHVKQEFDFAPRLQAIVSRGLILSNYPHLVAVEEDLWLQFKDGKMTEEQVVEGLNHHLALCVSQQKNTE